jgi:hypothetical protein
MNIILAFLFISMFLLWYVIGTKGAWWVKAFLIVFTLHFGVSLGVSMEGLLGWPSAQRLPDKFELHWALVEEPNSSLDRSGKIYLWVTDLEQDEAGEGDWRRFFADFSAYRGRLPRAYKIPYTRAFHVNVDAAMSKIAAGIPVAGEPPPEGEEGVIGEDSGYGDRNISGNSSDELKFYDLPRSKLPEKIE